MTSIAYLERGDAWMALAIPRGLRRRRSQRGSRRRVQIIADGSDANSAGVSLGYATNLIAGYGQEIAARACTGRGAPARVGGASSRASASGSTRGSRAATS